MKKIEVDNPNQIPAQIIADSIVEIGKGMKKLSSTRLTRKAVVALLQDDTRLAKGTIELVLDALESLELRWLKKRPEAK